MNYLLIYLKCIDQIVVNHDKHRDSMRHSPQVLCPKSSTLTVNGPQELLKKEFKDLSCCLPKLAINTLSRFPLLLKN